MKVDCWTFISLAVLTAPCFCQSSDDQAGPDEAAIARQIHDLVVSQMTCHSSPALTLAVVKNGKVVLTSGYGFTSTNKSRPVTSETRFAIGSLTKAFTSTLVAKWIHEQNTNITMDTPVRSFYPEFQVTDDLRSSMATLRDLLSHRMGIPSYFKALLMGFPLNTTREALMRRLAFMPSKLSFREKFVYNNYMYTLAAHVIEKMSGNQKWEELVRDYFLVPLSMNNTGFVIDLEDFSNFALPCALLNGSLVDVPTELFKTVRPCGPAGSIYSNAEDMAKWMNFLLSGGLGPGNQVVVDPSVIGSTWELSMISDMRFEELRLPEDPVSHVMQGYNMGWMTANYRGYQQIFHTGGVVTHSSRLWLYPDVKAGIYINVNGPQTNKDDLLESLLFYISDLLLNKLPWKKLNCGGPQTPPGLTSQHTTPVSSTTESGKSKDQEPGNSNATSNLGNFTASNATSNLSIFVGNYSHKFFGEIEILLDTSQEKLIFRFGQFGLMSLTQISELEFRCLFLGPLSYYNSDLNAPDILQFLRQQNGAISALLYSMELPDDLIQFDRINNADEIEDLQSNKNCFDHRGAERWISLLIFFAFISFMFVN